MVGDRPKPFVGVSGIKAAFEHQAIIEKAPGALDGTDRFIMVGVVDTNPVAALLDGTDKTRAFGHATYANHSQFMRRLTGAVQQASHYLRGLQLNCIPWMDTDYSKLITNFKEKHQHLALVLQAHEYVIRNYSPQQVAKRLARYPVDYILLDSSQSRGLEFDESEMRSYVDAIYQHQLPVGVVVSGGLEANNLGRLCGNLFKEYPDLSCDARGRLCAPGLKELQLPAVEAYLAAWRDTLR